MATPTLREDALQGLSVGLDIVAAFADSLPFPAAAIFTLAKNVITNVESIEGNEEECSTLDDHTRQLLTVVLAAMKAKADNIQEQYIHAQLEQNVGRFHDTLKKIDKTVGHICKVLHSKRKRDKLRAFVSTSWYAGELKKCAKDLSWAMELFKVTDQLENSLRIYRVSQQVDKLFSNSILESCPRAKRASSTSARHDSVGGCFEGTRAAILKLIFDWIIDPDLKIPRCFWLKGLAGIGKSTVAYSVARLARSRGIFAVDFFFSRLGDKELRDPTLVFPTLAYQLALLDPEFSRLITAALESHPDVGYSSLKNQLDRLIIEPLSKVKLDPKRIVVVILDAFDECEAKGAKEILQLLVAALPFLPFFLKIFITSRPEEHIRSVLIPSNNLHITALHDIEASVVKEDIEVYLRARLRSLPKELGRDDLGKDWITEAEIKLLVDAAGTFFIHAATVLRFLMGKLGPRKQLALLLKFIQSPQQTPGINPLVSLDRLYLQVLLSILDETTGAEVTKLFQIVVGSIVLLRDPLPVRALERLAALDDSDATELLNNLHSIILPPGPPDDCPRIYHPSFPDFLLDHSRCSDDNLWIDANVHEPRIALRCLEIMNASLHKNMLGVFNSCPLNSEVENLEVMLADCCLPELLYACRHWASHLAVVRHPADDRIERALGIFSARSLLAWLELLSWMGETRSASPSLEVANEWAAKSTCSQTTVSLLNDGYRLVLAHYPAIKESALHIARSVLPMAPRDIQLTSTYADYADPDIKVIDGVDHEWSACLMTLKGHTDIVLSIAVSPDGAYIVSGSADKTLHIWNANNGDLIAVLEGHTGDVYSVAFSSDGDRIVSGSEDRTVRLWNVITGQEVLKLEGHGDEINAVSFSPDGGLIASASHDTTIRLWDAVAGEVLRTLAGHSGSVNSLVFFPDGKRLASGSADQTIRVWDLEDGTCMGKLEGHFGEVIALSISSDGLQIASGSGDKTVQIWDVSSGRRTGTFQGHAGAVSAVTFSRDGSRIVSGSFDESVRLWDASSHDKIVTYNGHASVVFSVAVSRDGRHLVSGSADQTIKIWDTGASQGDTEDNNSANLGFIASLAFSSDKSRIAILACKITINDEESTVYIRDSATPSGSNLISFRCGNWSGNLWDSRVRFTAGDTRIAVTSNKEIFVYDASNGSLVEEPEDDDSDSGGQSLFSLEDGKILRHDTSPSTTTCILPPSLQANVIVSSELAGGVGHRVLVGCLGGRVVTLHVS